MKNFAVFVSGNGSNLQAIIDSTAKGRITGKIVLVVSDNKDAFALLRAERAGIKTFVFDPADYRKREEYERVILDKLKECTVEFVVLAGFMRLLTPYFINNFKNKILNIHPALLPAFPGMHGVRDALKSGVKSTGVSVHFVNEDIDAGPVILQREEAICEDDNEESLLLRLHRIEHEVYSEAIQLFIEGRLKVEGRRVKIIN